MQLEWWFVDTLDELISHTNHSQAALITFTYRQIEGWCSSANEQQCIETCK